MISRGTYAVPFLSLNGGRHVRTVTPCLSAVHEAIFGEPMREAVGPYCCAQFVVQDTRVRARPLEFYHRMLRLVDGTMQNDLCAPGRVTSRRIAMAWSSRGTSFSARTMNRLCD